MKAHVQKVFVFFLLMGVIFALGGCGGESQSPTSSTLPEKSNELSNFWASEGYYPTISAYVGDGYFNVFAPAGDYRITYSIKNGGTYYVAYKATKSAAVTIGFNPDHTLSEIWLQKGTIDTHLGYVWPSGPVTLYSWPGFTSPSWEHVFTPDPNAEEMLLYLP